MNHLKQKKLTYGYEFFGVGTHLELQRKMARMSSVVSRTPGLLNLWRGLGIEWGSEFSLDEVAGIVHEYGMAVVLFLSENEVADIASHADQNGLVCHPYALLESHEDTEAICAKIAQERTLPTGWREILLDKDSPPEWIAAFQKLSDEQGVAPSPGCLLRGLVCNAVSLMYIDEQDRPASVVFVGDRHHASGPYAGHFFAGGAAVGPKYRGLGFGVSIFARAMHYAYQSFEVKNIHAAVKIENLPSTRMCRRAGLTDQSRHSVILFDQDKFGGEFTR